MTRMPGLMETFKCVFAGEPVRTADATAQSAFAQGRGVAGGDRSPQRGQ